MSDAIKTYLANLRKALPYDERVAATIIREAKDHLMCSSRELRSNGATDTEAQAEAIARFGSPDDLIERFEREGGPMHAKDWKSSPILAALLVLPALLFVIANLLAFHVFSNSFLYQKLVVPVLDRPWSAIPANALITMGPLIALLLSGEQIITLQPASDENAHRQAVVELKWGHLAVIVISLCLATALGSYLLFENLPHL